MMSPNTQTHARGAHQLTHTNTCVHIRTVRVSPARTAYVRRTSYVLRSENYQSRLSVGDGFETTHPHTNHIRITTHPHTRRTHGALNTYAHARSRV